MQFAGIRFTARLLILALALAPCGAAQSDDEGRAQQHFEAARAAEKAGDLERAVSEYQQVLKLMPGVPEVQTNLGLAYYMMGRNDEAIDVFEKALKSKPDLLGANLFLGMSYLRTNRYEKSIEPLKKALALNE